MTYNLVLYKIKGFEALFEKISDDYYHVYGYNYGKPFEKRYMWYRCKRDEIIDTINLQSIIDKFWDIKYNNKERIKIVEGLILMDLWNIIGDLYIYLWRRDFNSGKHEVMYNIDLRKKILFNPIIVDELKKRNIKDRLNWYYKSILIIDDFQQNVLHQFD